MNQIRMRKLTTSMVLHKLVRFLRKFPFPAYTHRRHLFEVTSHVPPASSPLCRSWRTQASTTSLCSRKRISSSPPTSRYSVRRARARAANLTPLRLRPTHRGSRRRAKPRCACAVSCCVFDRDARACAADVFAYSETSSGMEDDTTVCANRSTAAFVLSRARPRRN